MKPLGLSLGLSDSGPHLNVSSPSKVEDAIWDAVELAIASGWGPGQFKDQAAQAWEGKLREDMKAAAKEFES